MPKYIDADILISQMQNRFHYLHGRKADPICIIEDAPSENIEPKRESGFWIDHKVWIDYENNIRETVRCSLCHDIIEIEYAKNYCSNCGVKMEKK